MYEALGGFSDMRYGEDIDFSIRIFAAGYKCRYFPGAWVYHKRRTNFVQFFRQVWHSGYAKDYLVPEVPRIIEMGTLPAGLICGRSAWGMYFRFFRSKGMGAIVILYFADLFF